MNKEINNAYKDKLKNRLYGALCEREKDGDWVKYLETIQIELAGRAAIEESQSINLYTLIGKIAMLRFLNYEYFRKTIFECMNLVDKYLGE